MPASFGSYTPDPGVIIGIINAAKKYGANPVVMIAATLTEDGGKFVGAPSDQSTGGSYGPFQLNAQGDLLAVPGKTKAAKIKLAQSQWAIDFKARAFARLGVTTGMDVANAQKPQNKQAYARKVNSLMPLAATIYHQYASGHVSANSAAVTPSKNALQTHGGGIANRLVQEAQIELKKGVPYSWGGGTLTGPSRGIAQGANIVGFDCSAFVRFIYFKVAGITLPRTAAAQYSSPLGHAITKSQLQPGDAVFFAGTDGPGITHEGLYIGNGQFIQAPHTGLNLDIGKLSDPYYQAHYAGARRYVVDPSKVQGPRNPILGHASTTKAAHNHPNVKAPHTSNGRPLKAAVTTAITDPWGLKDSGIIGRLTASADTVTGDITSVTDSIGNITAFLTGPRIVYLLGGAALTVVGLVVLMRA